MKLRHYISAFVLLTAALFPAPAQQAGGFDYYVLNLSWSPEFCYSNPAKPECGGSHHFGFVVHGLWPQSQRGGGPEYCSRAPGLSNPATMLDIMPDLQLIGHEWQAHGTCSALSARDYFNLIRKASASVRIPRQFANPAAQFAISPFDIKKAFEQSNPSLNDAAIAIGCRGAYLNSVSVCLSKDLHPVACTAMQDCRARTIRITPLK
jgi:ribonuclease T2